MTEAEILDKMIERLQDKGWVQGIIWEETFVPDGPLTEGFLSGLRSIKGKACLQGTVELCSEFTLSICELSAVADRLVAAITELFPERKEGQGHWDTVVKFNDHEDTTFEDVLLVVKTARGAA